MDIQLIYFISYLIFIGIYSTTVIFLLIQRSKREKEARPFITAMFIYFLCDLTQNIIQYFFNKESEFETNLGNLSPLLSLFTAIGYIIAIIGPVYLIFILEKNAFRSRLIKEKHLLTIVQLTLFAIYIVAVLYMSIFITGIEEQVTWSIQNTAVLYMVILVFQTLAFFGGFLYLGKNSTGKYRRNALLVAGGFFSYAFGNSIYLFYLTQLRAGIWAYDINIFIMVIWGNNIFRIIGLAMMTFFLVNLYRIKG